MATECLTWINGSFSVRPLGPNGSTVSDYICCVRRVLLYRPEKEGGHGNKRYNRMILSED